MVYSTDQRWSYHILDCILLCLIFMCQFVGIAYCDVSVRTYMYRASVTGCTVKRQVCMRGKL